MPANGRWDLIRRLKVKPLCGSLYILYLLLTWVKLRRFYTQLSTCCTSGYRHCHYRRSETRSLSHQTRLQTSARGTNRRVKASEKRTSNCLRAGCEECSRYIELPFDQHATRVQATSIGRMAIAVCHIATLLRKYQVYYRFWNLNNTQICLHRLKHYVSPFKLLDLVTCPYSNGTTGFPRRLRSVLVNILILNSFSNKIQSIKEAQSVKVTFYSRK